MNLSYQIWFGFNFVYHISLKRTFKNGFWVQIHLWNLCSSASNSRRLLCSKKLVWNVRIKAFWNRKKYRFIEFISPIVSLVILSILGDFIDRKKTHYISKCTVVVTYRGKLKMTQFPLIYHFSISLDKISIVAKLKSIASVA